MQGGADNPNPQQFNIAMNINRLKSSQSLKVFGGNTQWGKRKASRPLEIDNKPLPKRRRSRSKKTETPSTEGTKDS